MVERTEHEYAEYIESDTATADRLNRPRRFESTTGLISGLARDVTTLIRQEATLVRVELAEKVELARAGITAITSGALVTFAGGMFLLLAGMLALDEVLQRPWLSALVVGGVVMLIGLILLGRGRSNLAARNLVPERTKRSLQKDVELAREEVAKATTTT